MKQKIVRLILGFLTLFTSLGVGQEVILASVAENVVLQAVATGTPPLTYLWYKDGVPIPEATKSEYLVNTKSPGDAVYSVVVSNSVGSASSNQLNIQVIVLPKKAIDSHEVMGMLNALRKDFALFAQLKPLRFGKGGKET